MKPSLMWALVWPNSNVNTTRGLCPRWDAQAVMATRWNMSIKRHSPPRGRYVQVYNTNHAHPYRWTYTGQPLVRATLFSQTRRQQRQGRAWFSPRPAPFERACYPPRPYKRSPALLVANL